MTGTNVLNKIQKGRYKSCEGGGPELCNMNATVCGVS